MKRLDVRSKDSPPRSPEKNEHPPEGVEYATAHSRACNGCRSWGADVMLSVGTSWDDEDEGGCGLQSYDFFLTTAQAERLHRDLGRVLAANAQEEVERTDTGAGQ